MSERDVMLSGQPYKPWNQELQDDRDKARSLIERYNASFSRDKELRLGIVAALLGSIDKDHPPHIEAPFYCDYVSQHLPRLLTCLGQTAFVAHCKERPYCSASTFPTETLYLRRDTTFLLEKTSIATFNVPYWTATGLI